VLSGRQSWEAGFSLNASQIFLHSLMMAPFLHLLRLCEPESHWFTSWLDESRYPLTTEGF
jgi:hypothetical protein